MQAGGIFGAGEGFDDEACEGGEGERECSQGAGDREGVETDGVEGVGCEEGEG